MEKDINNSIVSVWAYRGYCTTVSFDDNTRKFSGIIENVDDLIYFECDDEDKVEKEFIAAVDEYIEILNK